MNSIANNEFQISDLIAVKYKENYLDYLEPRIKNQLKNVTFCPDTVYFMEKITTLDNGFYREYYEDVLYAIDLFERENKEPFQFNPDFIEEISFPKEYLTEEELQKGTVTRWRLFTIFQLVNGDFSKEIQNNDIKRIGPKVRR